MTKNWKSHVIFKRLEDAELACRELTFVCCKIPLMVFPDYDTQGWYIESVGQMSGIANHLNIWLKGFVAARPSDFIYAK